MQVLTLQNKIANLTAWSDKLQLNVSLEDICFSPLHPDNPRCAIMSVLNYYQNDPKNLEKAILDEFGFTDADYLNHFSICAQ